MKNSADLGGCYPPRPSASADNTLLDLLNSSYPTQPHSIIAKYTTQVNGTFRARWLVSSEVISQVLMTFEQPKKNKIAFIGILSQIKLLFKPLVIQLVWYILKQLFTSVSVKVVPGYLPPLPWIIVNYKNHFLILKMIWETSIHHFLWLDFILKYVFKKLLSAPPPRSPLRPPR